MTTFLIEESHTPIYQRIVLAIAAAMKKRGILVRTIPCDTWRSAEYAKLLRAHAGATYLSTNDQNVIQQRKGASGQRIWDDFDGKLVFLHHDSMFSEVSELVDTLERLRGMQKLGSRAAHLCLEPSNLALLRSLGIQNVRSVPHATEITPTAPSEDALPDDLCFVGHVLPSRIPAEDDGWVDETVAGILQVRLQDFSAALLPRIALACLPAAESELSVKVAYQQWMTCVVNRASTSFRGKVLASAMLPSLVVHGGDPGYLHGLAGGLQLGLLGVTYKPAVYGLDALRAVYRQCAVSLNISSPQFDYAVPNRFHDVFMSGGFCLTDRRSGLSALTRYHDEVSYSTLSELREKAAYYARPDKRGTRARLIAAVQEDIAENSGYDLLVDHILDAIDAPAPRHSKIQLQGMSA
jgi:hypothetical protein